MDTTARAKMSDRLDRLVRAGFELVGTTSPSEDPARAADEAENITDLRSHIAGSAFRADATASSIRKWLDDHSGLLMVVWIRLDDAKVPDAWLVSRTDIAQEPLRAANRAFHANTPVRGQRP